MTIDQILAAIAALQDAGTDEAVIKKMVLQMLAEDTGADVSVPAGDAGAAPMVATDPQPGQGAAPITAGGQPMAARNPKPAATKPNAPANYGNQGQNKNLGVIAELIGKAFGAAHQPTPKPQPAPSAPAAYANVPAPQASSAEQLLTDTLFAVNEQRGLHTGQNSAFLKRLLKSDPALYSEAIAGAQPVTFDGGGSPSPIVGNRPLANTQGGELAERNALANKIKTYRDTQAKALGRPVSWNEAMTAVLQSR